MLAFLNQQRAIRRSALRRRDPPKFRGDWLRVILARATELGWSRERVYQFAAEELNLKQAMTSLKQLGPVQLETLAGKLCWVQPAPSVV